MIRTFEEYFKDGNYRSNIHLLISMIGVILCFTPLYGNVESLIETPESVSAIEHGILFKCASVVSLTLAFLLFLDLFSDFIMSLVARAKQQRVKDLKRKDNHVDILIDKEKGLFLVGLVILPMPLAGKIPNRHQK